MDAKTRASLMSHWLPYLLMLLAAAIGARATSCYHSDFVQIGVMVNKLNAPTL